MSSLDTDPAPFVDRLASVWARSSDGPRIRFVWIFDRRTTANAEAFEREVSAFVRCAERHPEVMAGIDLAGDESVGLPEFVPSALRPIHERCHRVTIHAGEGQAARNIWDAAYLFHADRIGHGLSLAENPELAARFRDRDIALELCPTSNLEVVGFADGQRHESRGFPGYPFRRLWEMGVALTINTDNPGISRTDIANEYVVLGRLDQKLTRWEVLALLRQAWVHAFLPASERETQLKLADQALFVHLTRRS